MSTETAVPAGDGLGPTVPDTTLSRCKYLPTKPNCPTLMGRFVEVRPFETSLHLSLLIDIFNGKPAYGHKAYDARALIWNYMRGFISQTHREVTNAAVEGFLLRLRDLSDGQLFTVWDKKEDTPIGVLALLANRPTDLVVEIGAIAFTPAYQGTAANTESTFLLMNWAFEAGYRRVEWKCDSRNARSMAAAKRIGFAFEGIFRQHMIVSGDRSRDTAWFSIIDGEWSEKKEALKAWLTSDAPVQLYAKRRAALESA